MCDIPMNPCEPIPNNGINISISIDLGSFMNPQCPPSTSLTKMPPPPPPMDEGKTICFLDEKEECGFDKAKKNTLSKFGGKDVDKDQKYPSKNDEGEECEEE